MSWWWGPKSNAEIDILYTFCQVTGFFQELYFCLTGPLPARCSQRMLCWHVWIVCCNKITRVSAYKILYTADLKSALLCRKNGFFFHNLVVVKKKELKKKLVSSWVATVKNESID